ncbi:hypothetical protein ASE00_18175 [Sphingomonas sp. Root710]|nr:hypothetical protein ASE00_18175 [Sphingomonas sp. Root710]
MAEDSGPALKFFRRNGRSVGEFNRIDKAIERLNPESIRRLFYDTIHQQFGGNVRKAVTEFADILKRSENFLKFRRHKIGISEDSLYKLTKDKQLVSYTQLDALAQHHKVPLGLLLIFTRLRSEISSGDGDHERLVKMTGGLKAAITMMESRIRAAGREGSTIAMDHDAFIDFVEAYRSRLPEVQSSLLD